MRVAPLLGLALALSVAPVSAATDPVPLAVVKVAEVSRRLAAGERVVLVDVRTDEEYRARHIRGALSVPLHALEARYREIPRQGLVVLY